VIVSEISPEEPPVFIVRSLEKPCLTKIILSRPRVQLLTPSGAVRTVSQILLSLLDSQYLPNRLRPPSNFAASPFTEEKQFLPPLRWSQYR